MSRLFFMIASVMGFLSVALGAFAAHGLEDMLTAEMIGVFETGVQYQMFHVTALLAVAVLCQFKQAQTSLALLKWSGYLFSAGIILFSGSLYVLSISGISVLGIITPIGGVAFLLAWSLLFYSVLRQGVVVNE